MNPVGKGNRIMETLKKEESINATKQDIE